MKNLSDTCRLLDRLAQAHHQCLMCGKAREGGDLRWSCNACANTCPQDAVGHATLVMQACVHRGLLPRTYTYAVGDVIAFPYGGGNTSGLVLEVNQDSLRLLLRDGTPARISAVSFQGKWFAERVDVLVPANGRPLRQCQWHFEEGRVGDTVQLHPKHMVMRHMTQGRVRDVGPEGLFCNVYTTETSSFWFGWDEVGEIVSRGSAAPDHTQTSPPNSQGHDAIKQSGTEPVTTASAGERGRDEQTQNTEQSGPGLQPGKHCVLKSARPAPVIFCRRCMAPAVRGLDGYCRGCFDAFGAEVKLDATIRAPRAPDERHPSDWDPDDALYEVLG